MKLYYFILGIVLLGVLFVFYYHLGGFKKIVVEKIEGQEPYEIRIWGKNFHGNIQDENWKKLFIEIRDHIVKEKLQGPITVIYDKAPGGKGDNEKIDAFIGLPVPEGDTIPPGFTEKSFDFKGVLSVRLTMHTVVMPSPQKVKKIISRYAAMNNLHLDSLQIEKYYPDNTLTVEVPFK